MNTPLIRILTAGTTGDDHFLQLECANDAWEHSVKHYAAVGAGQPSDLYATSSLGRIAYRPILDAAAWAAAHPDHPILRAFHATLPFIHYIAVGHHLLGEPGDTGQAIRLPGLAGMLPVLTDQREAADPTPDTPLVIAVTWAPDTAAHEHPAVSVVVAALPAHDQRLPTMAEIEAELLADLLDTPDYPHHLPLLTAHQSIAEVLPTHDIHVEVLADDLGACLSIHHDRITLQHPEGSTLHFARLTAAQRPVIEVTATGHHTVPIAQSILATWTARHAAGDPRYPTTYLLWPAESTYSPTA